MNRNNYLEEDGCRLHPSEPILAVCEKLGNSYCASCFQQGMARCLGSREPCKYRPYCLVRQFGVWLQENGARSRG